MYSNLQSKAMEDKMKKRKYDDESIISITEDRDRVIKRPTIYVPTMGWEGILHLIEEIFDNSADELGVKGSPGKNLTASYDIKTKEVTIIDDGTGIPIKSLLRVLTVLNTSGKFDMTEEDSAYENAGGTNGMGVKLVVYLSDYLVATSTRDGQTRTIKFEHGVVVSDETTKADKKDHGTVIRFRISKKHFSYEGFSEKLIATMVKEKSYIFPDFKIRYIELDNGKELKNKLYTGKDIHDRFKKFEIDTPSVSILVPDYKYEVIKKDLSGSLKLNLYLNMVFGFSDKAMEENDQAKNIVSYANTIRTTMGGKHVEGMRDGIVKFIKQEFGEYLNKKETETLQVTTQDITNSLVAIMHIKISNPVYRGQYKDQINNVEMKTVIRDVVYSWLCDNISKSDLKKIMEYIKEVVKGKLAAKSVKKKKAVDYDNVFSKNALSKYYPFSNTSKTFSPRLVILEGDTALNQMLQCRDPNNDALMSITGRPKNIIDNNASSPENAKSIFMKICEISGIQIGKNFNIEDFRFDYIDIMTDADIDGEGMSISLLGLFAKFTPELIKRGKIRRIHPPLYKFTHKGKERYITSQAALYSFVADRFKDDLELVVNGVVMTDEWVTRFISDNFMYNDRLSKLAKKYSAPMKLIERIVYFNNHTSKDVDKVSYWNKVITPIYDEMEVTKVDGEIYISGTLVDDDGRDSGLLIILDKYFRDQSYSFKKIMNNNFWFDKYSLGDRENLTIFDVMREFEKYMPKDLQRYKGAGEVKAQVLKDLCFDRERMVCTVFKFGDIERDMRMIYTMLSTKDEFVKARAELMMNSAIELIDIDN